MPDPSTVQQNQPDGVPPLSLTGERTLPDVAAENYWFRRHLAVYEWIAARERGSWVIDMACGEGYGADVLARAAAQVVGVDANPEAHEHARLRYRRANLRFARELVESFSEPGAGAGEGAADAIVFLQTIEHLQDPRPALEHFRELLRPGGRLYVSTPNVLTLAPKGAPRSDNPWHVHEYRAGEFSELLRGLFGEVELWGLFHARKLRAHEIALDCGWDRVHRGLRITEPFYARFIPAIATRDFRLARTEDLDRALDFLALCRV